MAYLNKIDINGRTYYLQHLTDGKYEASLPVMTKDSKIIIQDTNSSNIGDIDTPVYIKDNKVVAFNKSIGDAVTPVYMKYGNIQPLSDDVGSTTNPIYMKAGAITASNETVGTNIKLIYMHEGTITESNANVGSGVVPTYMNNGEITASTTTVGSNVKPIYLNAGTITVSDGNVGSEIIPVYMVDGEITQTTKTVGSGIKPIYMNNGAITDSTSTVGAINQPIYMNNGEMTVCSDNVGSSGIPVYMENGVITACGTIPISSGGTDATTPEQALVNFGLTATAAELNTLDGITATVTELNYVDGVTSNVQEQFNGHENRILTIEAFFKEADIDASQEFIDTLKEIQTYIADDKTGATNMALAIKDNKDNIDILNGTSTTKGSVAKAIADTKAILDEEIAKKVDKVNGMGLSANDYSNDEKSKLAGIETGANKYVHPTRDVAITSGFYKISFDELGHVSSVEAVTKADIIELGIPAQDTTYEVAVATTETEDGIDGLLSATDKAKYDKYEATIANLQEQINKLKEYHPTTETE